MPALLRRELFQISFLCVSCSPRHSRIHKRVSHPSSCDTITLRWEYRKGLPKSNKRSYICVRLKRKGPPPKTINLKHKNPPQRRRERPQQKPGKSFSAGTISFRSFSAAFLCASAVNFVFQVL